MSVREIYLVTGNPNKVTELQALLPDDIHLQFASGNLDEIQGLDYQKTVSDKLARAYDLVHKPVIVEDTWAGLKKLHGLPGPYIKDFEKKLGPDALYKLAHGVGERAVIHCFMGYFDGETQHIVVGEAQGTIVEPQGSNGFGFDICFIQDGNTKTNAELSPEEKNRDSHRARAVRALVGKIRAT